MIRRLKREIKRWDGMPYFPERDIIPLPVHYSDADRAVHDLLRRYARSRLTQVKGSERMATEFVLKLLKKRLFSSPAAFARTLEKHRETVTVGQRQIATFAGNLPSVLRQYINQAEEDHADEEEQEADTTTALRHSAAHMRVLSPAEADLLADLCRRSSEARDRADSKSRQLVAWLRRELMPGDVWSNERVIIFTEYRDTQKWLYEQFALQRLTAGDRVMLLHGGMNSDEREQIKAAFQADPRISPVRILLATDAASEGIDLQNHCSRLIHYEIPWNPNRMEQRNGRIDRHGQKATRVRIHHFVSDTYREESAATFTSSPDSLDGDLEFLMRAVRKVEQIREDLGSVGDLIARQVEEAMLGRRSKLDTSPVEQRSAASRRLLKVDRDLREQTSKLHEKLLQSREDLHITPANIEAAVQLALRLAGQPPLEEVSLNGARAFRVPAFKGSWAICAEGLKHPHTHVERPIVFDDQDATDRDDVVLAHLNSRLVQMSLRLLRAEVGASENTRKLSRVTARLSGSQALRDPAMVVHARLIVISAEGERLHEEILTAGGTLREGRFQRMNVGETQAEVDSGLPTMASEAMQRALAAQAPRHVASLEQALNARTTERMASLKRLLEERAERERRDISAILTDLRESIRQQLNHPELSQLELFESEEREQLEQHRSALERRFAEIPSEITREVEAITRRYADPQPRAFPVAVTYLVPERLDREARRG
jgi:superfamily II DNA/RNA helicase